jgi:hypothetical protein
MSTNEIDIFKEVDEERAERMRRWSELALAELEGKEVPIDVELEETIKDIELEIKEAKIAEKALERVEEALKGKVESQLVEIIGQCAWWLWGEGLLLSAIKGSLKRALEELRRRHQK